MRATDLLRQQHQTVKDMFGQMDTARGDARSDLFDCLRATLATHETAEEMVVHPAAKATGAEGARVVEARLAEEAEAKRVLADLEKLTPAGDGFDSKFADFRKAAMAHAEAEERELFPILESKVDPERLREMSDAIERAERMAPTHAHPHSPESASGNMLVGPFVAMVDKVRDRLKDHATSK